MGQCCLGAEWGAGPFGPETCLTVCVTSDVRRGLWRASPSWGGWAVFWQGGAGSWGATAMVELDPVAVAQWVTC